MLKDYELDCLKSELDEAFAHKQEAYRVYDEARKKTDSVYAAMFDARDALNRARAEMNDAYEEFQRAKSASREVWDEYGRIRDYNNSEIESLKYEADSEYQDMRTCFESASSEYEYGDRAMASEYSQQGHVHKDRLAELNARIRELGQEVKQAKENAQWRAPKVDDFVFKFAQRAFQDAKARYESLRAEFDQLKTQRDYLHDQFELAKACHENAKENFQKRLAEVKAKKEREQILNRAGVGYYERGDAKIVKKADGTTQVYHGGLGSGDGLGHGHTALDKSGKKTYDRGAFEEHGGQNFIENGNVGRSKNPGAKPSNGGWTPFEKGVVFGEDGEAYNVTFREGLGGNEGQTLISDGYISGKQFRTHHNHYGPNDKSRFPDQPDRIEDSDTHKNDDAYTGPGH